MMLEEIITPAKTQMITMMITFDTERKDELVEFTKTVPVSENDFEEIAESGSESDGEYLATRPEVGDGEEAEEEGTEFGLRLGGLAVTAPTNPSANFPLNQKSIAVRVAVVKTVPGAVQD
ncbi:hypothetical protein HK096_011438 [Nowakowskiella sp. JEL0078]|nr:hypothetical protein HK096_011438 [Nowakowskiella sp. JEL0078]